MLERILIVGLGSIGTRHARLIRELMPDVHIIALRHRNQPDNVAPPIDSCVTSLDEALRLGPQAAVIASPSSYHLEVAFPLAQAGVDLLVEKPIADTTRRVSELIDVCRSHEIVLMTGYNLRFLPCLQRFRELLEKNTIGRVLSVRAEVGQFLPSWRAGCDYRKSVSAQAALGGGALLELSHEIDYLRWLFGEVGWVSAVQSRQSGLDIDVEDTVYLILGFTQASGDVPVIGTLNMDFVRHDTTRVCTAIGETGSLRWNAVAGSVEIFEKGGTAWQTLFTHQQQRDESYRVELRHFLKCVKERASPIVSGNDGLAVLRIIEAARHSSFSRAVVAIK